MIAHDTACRVLHTLVSYDQYDVSESAAAEIISRQIQMIEERHRDGGAQSSEGKNSAHSSQDTHLFLGTAASRGGLCVCPALQEWISEELRRESSIMKERRKAREERALNNKGPKGGPKGE